jgi:hypothetical protein
MARAGLQKNMRSIVSFDARQVPVHVKTTRRDKT